jgi:hypothetical protein
MKNDPPEQTFVTMSPVFPGNFELKNFCAVRVLGSTIPLNLHFHSCKFILMALSAADSPLPAMEISVLLFNTFVSFGTGCTGNFTDIHWHLRCLLWHFFEFMSKVTYVCYFSKILCYFFEILCYFFPNLFGLNKNLFHLSNNYVCS